MEAINGWMHQPSANCANSFVLSLQFWVNWLTLQGKHSEYALVDSAEWFFVNEPLQRLQSQSKLPDCERSPIAGKGSDILPGGKTCVAARICCRLLPPTSQYLDVSPSCQGKTAKD